MSNLTLHTDIIHHKSKNEAYLWAAGQEGLNVDVRVVHFEIVVPETSGHPDGRQHTSLQKIRGMRSSTSIEQQPTLIGGYFEFIRTLASTMLS